MTAAHRGADPTTKAIVMLVIATLFFAWQDALTKHLVQTLPASQIVAVRFFFFALFALAYVSRRIGIATAFRSQRPWLQIFRGLLLSGEIIVFAYAIQFLGLAEMHTLFACFPLLITALSVPLLRESVGWRRWLAVFFGFIGTLIILRPDSGVFQPAAAIALAAALMFALYNILTRKVSRHDSFETSLLYMGVVGFAGSHADRALLLAPGGHRRSPVVAGNQRHLHHRPSAVNQVAGTGSGGYTAAVQLLCADMGDHHRFFRIHTAKLLSPATLLGAGIVVGSGVFIARREYKLLRGLVLVKKILRS